MYNNPGAGETEETPVIEEEPIRGEETPAVEEEASAEEKETPIVDEETSPTVEEPSAADVEASATEEETPAADVETSLSVEDAPDAEVEAPPAAAEDETPVAGEEEVQAAAEEEAPTKEVPASTFTEVLTLFGKDFADDLTTLEGKTYELVYAGLGNAFDFEGIDVQGKVALIARGDIALDAKIVNARKAGGGSSNHL
ncbi:hypothetical protein Q0F98_05515 [Paenibacillus amylolyticus]|nr:hypothetical protein Q0F98_05515 [Paenibacillus amylolyticus]